MNQKLVHSTTNLQQTLGRLILQHFIHGFPQINFPIWLRDWLIISQNIAEKKFMSSSNILFSKRVKYTYPCFWQASTRSTARRKLPSLFTAILSASFWGRRKRSFVLIWLRMRMIWNRKLIDSEIWLIQKSKNSDWTKISPNIGNDSSVL